MKRSSIHLQETKSASANVQGRGSSNCSTFSSWFTLPITNTSPLKISLLPPKKEGGSSPKASVFRTFAVSCSESGVRDEVQ